MIKVLIIDDNLNYGKIMLNSIINKFDNMKLLYIATTYKESIDIILHTSIDLIFLDLNLPDCNGCNIVKELKHMNLIKKPHIVVISGDNKLIYEIKKNNYICEIINKVESAESIYKKIEKIIKEINYENNCNEIKKFISEELLELGYNFKYKGTQYITEAIIYIYQSNNWDIIDNLERNVYKYLSNRHKKSINNIKTNIIKATNCRIKEKILLYDLTPKMSIITVLTKVKHQFY